MLSIMHKLDLSGKPDPKRCEPVLSIRLHGVGNVFLFQMLLLHPQISTWAFDTPNVQPIIKSCSPIQKLFAFHNVTPIVQPDYKRLYLPTCTSCSPIINVYLPTCHTRAWCSPITNVYLSTCHTCAWCSRIINVCTFPHVHRGIVQLDYKRLPSQMLPSGIMQPDYKRLYCPTCHTRAWCSPIIHVCTFLHVTPVHGAARLQTSTFPHFFYFFSCERTFTPGGGSSDTNQRHRGFSSNGVATPTKE